MEEVGVSLADETSMAEPQDEETEALDASRHIHASKAWLFASILLTLFIALLASVTSQSSTLLAILGFTPTLLATVIFLGLLEGEFRDVLFWLTPLALLILFLGMEPFTRELLGGQLDIPALAAVNLVLSYSILAVMSLIEYRREKLATLADLEQFQPEALDQYIQTIEDKCKALNFVIGRVYRASNGGTKGLREKIKVPSEWYNEFNAIKPEEVREQRDLAIDLLTRIEERLMLLLKPEKDVFSKAEVKALHTLARDGYGRDRIIDVLSINDSDPVEDYYLGARDFCKRVKEGLAKL